MRLVVLMLAGWVAGLSLARADATCPAAPAPAPQAAPVGVRQVFEDRLQGQIASLHFSPDGAYLAAASGERMVRVWDARSHHAVATVPRTDILPPWTLAWAPDPGRVLVGQSGPTVMLDVATGAQVGVMQDGGKVHRLPGHPATPYVGAHGNGLALFDATLHVAAELAWPGEPASAYLAALAVSADGATIAGAGSTGLFVWSPLDRPARVTPVVGTVHDVALSSDGAFAAIAVETPHTTSGKVLIVATKDGKTVRELATPLYASADYPTTVAISRDGVVAAGSLHAVAAWDLATGRPRWQIAKESTSARGASGYATALDFSPTTGQLAVGDAVGGVHLFDATTGRQLAELGVGVRRPSALRFLSDGSLAALSASAVTRWSPARAERVASHGARWPAVVTEAPDGGLVVGRFEAFTFNQCPNAVAPIFIEDADALELTPDAATTRGLHKTKRAAALVRSPAPICMENTSQLADLDAATGRALLDTSASGGLAVVSLVDHKRVALAGSGQASFSRAFSHDGSLVVATDLQHAFVWDARTGAQRGAFQITDPQGFASGAAAAVLSRDGTQIALLINQFGSTFAVFDVASGAQRWQLSSPVPILAMSFRGDSHDLIVGTFGGELGVIRDGKLVVDIPSTFGAIGLVTSSPDGRLVATMHVDGGVRLWDLDRKAVRASFFDYEDDEWAITTPGGAYTGTSEVASRIGWVFDQPLESFGFEQFAATFHQPDLVRRRLGGEATDAAAVPARPPIATVVSARASASGATGTIVVHAKAGARVDTVWLYREGRPVAHKTPCQGEVDVTFSDVVLLAGVNHFEATAIDERGFSSNPAALELRGTGPQPDVWVVAVGVSAYPRLTASEQLRFASADAVAIGQAFAAAAGPGRAFAHAHVTTLTDAQVSVGSVRAALAELEKMGPNDLAVLLFAGHGVESPSGMRFLTSAGDLSDARIASEGLGWGEVSDRIEKMRGRVLLLLDACHAGHLTQDLVVPNGALANGLARAGRVGAIVFAASKGRQDSQERAGHGVFTQALLDALAAKDTDHDRDGALQLSEVIDAVTLRVEHDTGGEQTPWVARREIFGDFALAVTPQ